MRYQKIRDKFREYLLQRVKMSEAECEKTMDFVELNLPIFIHAFLDSYLEDVYAITDYKYYRDLRAKVSTTPEADEMNKRTNYQFTETLKLYTSFLESKFFKGKEKVQLTAGEQASKKKGGNTAQSKKEEETDDPLLPPEHPEEELTEGKIRQVSLTAHERNRLLRKRCLSYYGYRCRVCGMDFEEQYGEIGKDFIEVHHLNPISQTAGEHELDPINDMVPLCSNCHSMIHRGGKDGNPMPLEELRRLYRQHNF